MAAIVNIGNTLANEEEETRLHFTNESDGSAAAVLLTNTKIQTHYTVITLLPHRNEAAFQKYGMIRFQDWYTTAPLKKPVKTFADIVNNNNVQFTKRLLFISPYEFYELMATAERDSGFQHAIKNRLTLPPISICDGAIKLSVVYSTLGNFTSCRVRVSKSQRQMTEAYKAACIASKDAEPAYEYKEKSKEFSIAQWQTLARKDNMDQIRTKLSETRSRQCLSDVSNV